ncbi:MAG: DUF2891 family protein [Methyloligellaceae bacterium]
MRVSWFPDTVLILLFSFFSICNFSAANALGPVASESSELVARQFSKTIAKCVSRQDTDHIIFNGCIDWHSSVHGMWALIAYMRATGDKRYENLVFDKLTEQDIQAEYDFLKANPRFEMPYGRAWFLRLAIEYSKYTGRKELKKMADHVLFSMIKYYSAKPPRPLDISYNNSAWALINMLDYAQYTKNAYAVRFIVSTARKHFYVEDLQCPKHVERGHFMAVCSNWAWLVGKVVPKVKFQDWLTKFYQTNGYPTPAISLLGWHHYGLNFSRSWGLIELYNITGQKKFLKLSADHFRIGYRSPKNWRGSYRGVGHWVPQFGMFALQPSFGKERGR